MRNFFQLGSWSDMWRLWWIMTATWHVIIWVWRKPCTNLYRWVLQDMYRSLGDMWWWQLVVLMVAYSVSYAQISAVWCGRVFCIGRTLTNVWMAINSGSVGELTLSCVILFWHDTIDLRCHLKPWSLILVLVAHPVYYLAPPLLS